MDLCDTLILIYWAFTLCQHLLLQTITANPCSPCLSQIEFSQWNKATMSNAVYQWYSVSGSHGLLRVSACLQCQFFHKLPKVGSLRGENLHREPSTSGHHAFWKSGPIARLWTELGKWKSTIGCQFGSRQTTQNFQKSLWWCGYATTKDGWQRGNP